MGKLDLYKSLDEKKTHFNNDNNKNDVSYYKIDHAYQFNNWYNEITASIKDEGVNKSKYKTFFRGTNEAKYKLYNSAQRYWIQNNLMQLESLTLPVSYLQMIQNMVNNAKNVRLLQQVFEYYEIIKNKWISRF